uniref:Photosystem I assembly protein Ycf4 n=1 Tax=Cyanophora biloba TaxID=1489483 RepID=A0A2Z4HG94_9EUKA|nr:photosystem I assembly protein Ycf4 [Cyanophora biloba]AWW13810.1 photosystem I assembly protein Ycf4 [Cyanophora biloba]
MNSIKLSSDTNQIKRDLIIGSRRISNYWWAITLGLGALGFILAGISSYTKINLLPLTNTSQFLFIPQGITMLLYGTVGILLDIYLWLLISWNIGAGYNEYNKKKGIVSIFRWGFPGQNRRIEIIYPIEQIQAIKLEIKQGLNPRHSISLKIREKNEIVITPIGYLLPISVVEEQAANLSSFLNIPLDSNQ